MRRRLFVAGAVLVLAVCGLPEDERPHLVAAADAPLDLSPSTAPLEPPPEVGEESAEVFFLNIDQTQLRLARRPVEAISVVNAINALLFGLIEEERVELSNAIPQGVVLRSVSLAETGLLTVDLGPAGEGGLQSVQGGLQQRAFAQLVYTATAVPGVINVRFLIEGVPIDAPTDGEALAEVNRGHYLSVSPSGAIEGGP